jgi:diguanylate cyclase (GGDEF)-like protein
MTDKRAERDSPARLLIVDDDAVTRRLAVSTLQHAGFGVTEAASGEEALTRVADAWFDLVLLDVMMPGIDGYEVCARLRAMQHVARIPIVMLTGLADTQSVELAFGQGATDFITKPINWALLPHKIRYALRASAAAEMIRAAQESLARAQILARMGNWTLFADGRMEGSTQLADLFGIPAAIAGSVSSGQFLRLVIPSDRAGVASARTRLLNDGIPYQMEYQIARDDGDLRTLFEQATPALDTLGRRHGGEGITQDITDRTRASERIRQLAGYDPTTGLPNRRLFTELSAPALEYASRNAAGCAVLHVDIDRFKSVNDAFGRETGDIVLKRVTERLRTCIRRSDHAGHAGDGEEGGIISSVGGNAFTVLVTDVAGEDRATTVTERLLAAIAAPLSVDAHTMELTACIGIALFPADAADLTGLTHCAEQALHAAKQAGRGQHRFFNAQMNAHAASRLRLEAEFRRAINQEELQLYYQPKVDAITGAIVGAEALVRWQHPTRGLLTPDTFIGMAEESGLILPMTDWVLLSACRSLRNWADAGLPGVVVSVNLAAPSLSGMSLVGKLDALIDRFALAPQCLILEVTETILVRDIGSCAALLEALRTRGYKVSLDDFGTGYSSLSYLNRMPLDEIKIDRAFVTEAARSGRDGALASAIIALGRELGLHVVAEGVETHEQSAFLPPSILVPKTGELPSQRIHFGEIRTGIMVAAALPRGESKAVPRIQIRRTGAA